MAKTLVERIASARSTDRVTIADLERLIADATAERDRLSAASVQASGDSVNFALSDHERDEAASKADRLSRTATGLANEIDELSEKLAAKRNSERRHEIEAEKASIVAERDALAKRLKAEWPELEAAMVALLSAVRASDDRMRAAGIHEASAEAVARGCEGNFQIGPSPVRRLTEIKLPSFADGRELAWPVVASPVQSWAITAENTRQSQVERRREADARESARWAWHQVMGGYRVPFWTEIPAKQSPEQTQVSKVDFYNHRPVSGEAWPCKLICIRDDTVQWLRESGFEVVPAEPQDIAA